LRAALDACGLRNAFGGCIQQAGVVLVAFIGNTFADITLHPAQGLRLGASAGLLQHGQVIKDLRVEILLGTCL
jgi:hypothetical protein